MEPVHKACPHPLILPIALHVLLKVRMSYLRLHDSQRPEVMNSLRRNTPNPHPLVSDIFRVPFRSRVQTPRAVVDPVRKRRLIWSYSIDW